MDIPLATGPLLTRLYRCLSMALLWLGIIYFVNLQVKSRSSKIPQESPVSPVKSPWLPSDHTSQFSTPWHLTLLLSDALLSLSKHQGENPQTQQTNKHP